MSTETVGRIREALNCYRESYDAAERASRLLSSGPATYYWEKIECYVTALFEKYAPFHEGDRVALLAAPDIKPSSVCYFRHFLIAGAVGTVSSVDYSKSGDGFVADVVFDDESWIDQNGVVQPSQNKHTYCIGEKILRRITE